MKKTRNYIQLHLNILLFSLTSVFSKCASVQFNHGGLKNSLLYLFLFLMAANCGVYAIAWQKVDQKIFFVYGLCQPERLPDLVSGVGGGDLSGKSECEKYHRPSCGADGSDGGAKV